MPKRLDFNSIKGKKINYLTVIKEVEHHTTSGGHIHRAALFSCECGKEFIAQISSVTTGSTKSCGCFSRKIAGDRLRIANKKHGMYNTPEYNAWSSLKKRCINPKHKSYKDYGGRGIKICDSWIKNFENFLEDMGLRPGPTHSIDRIDVNGDYHKDNCRWATKKEQSRNQRNNVLIYYEGKIKCLGEWSEILNIHYSVLFYRLNIGKWGINKAFNTPVK